MSSALYRALIQFCDQFVPVKLQPLWNHPAGPKTVFFWAPLVKWGLVFAGLGDLINRPADKISMNQTATLALTGVIWSRYSLVITPVNYNLFSVNMFLALLQSMNLYRAYDYQRSISSDKK